MTTLTGPTALELAFSKVEDDLWKSIVLSIASALTVFDEAAQERILAIAGSAPDIGDLATAVPPGRPGHTRQNLSHEQASGSIQRCGAPAVAARPARLVHRGIAEISQNRRPQAACR